MDLLATIQRNALDPEYRRVAERGRPAPRPLLLALGLALAAALVVMAAAQTNRTAPVAEQERADLISRVRAAQAKQDRLEERIAEQDSRIRLLQPQSQPSAAVPRLQEAMVGLAAVEGSGVVVTIDDADAPSTGSASPARVTDQDLRRLVNGLWEAGAEAIAINGHRISGRTAIRSAGSAITVDYRSLNHPYRVEAIGDPSRMPSLLGSSSAGQWWSFLRDNFGLSYEVTTAKDLTLPADPGLGVRKAKVAR